MLPSEERVQTAAPSTIVVPGKGALGVQGAYDYAKYYTNAPADARLNDIVSRKAPGLRTGLIQTVDKFAGDKYFRSCKFMFNPSVITTSYSVAEGVTPRGELTVDQAKGLAVYPGQTGVGFSLLFDRVYDVYYGPKRGGKDLRKVGVYEDIGALEAVTGVYQSVTAAYTTSDSTGTTTDANGAAVTTDIAGGLQGNMLMVPVYLIFGGGKYSAAPGLSYVGYITSMTVQWGLFSQDMIPTRCSVDITFQQLIGKGVQEFGNVPDNTSAYRQKL